MCQPKLKNVENLKRNKDLGFVCLFVFLSTSSKRGNMDLKVLVVDSM